MVKLKLMDGKIVNPCHKLQESTNFNIRIGNHSRTIGKSIIRYIAGMVDAKWDFNPQLGYTPDKGQIIGYYLS